MNTAILVLLVMHSLGDAQESHPELAKAKLSWKKYDRMLTSYSGKFEFRLTEFKKPDKLQLHTIGQVTHSTQGSLLKYDAVVGNRKDKKVEAFNDQYWFLLQGKKDRPDDLFVAQVKVRQDNTTVDQIPKLEHKTRTMISPLMVNDLYLPEVINEPTFVIEKVEPALTNGEKLIRLVFRYAPPLNSKSYVRSGSIILDPEKFWTIREWQVAMSYVGGNTSNDHKTYEMRIDKRGTPVIKRSVQESVVTGAEIGTGSLTRTEEFDIETGKPDSNEFRLAHYGKPEPSGLVSKSSNHWYLSGGAVVFVAILIGLRYFLRPKRG